MWMWLRTLVPEIVLHQDSPALDRDGLDWRYVAEHQRFALLRRGGLLNLLALPSVMLLWLGIGFAVSRYAAPVWLFVPATLSLVVALGHFKRYRLIVDTPTSRLSSGAQGYVELHGTARLPEGESFRGLPHLPVTLWLPGYVEDLPFVLDDGTGQCLIYPSDAEIITQAGDTHFSWLTAIYPGQTLYALGELQTLRPDSGQAAQRERVAALLAEWKRDPAQLRQHFDTDANGELDAEEWQQVRQAAEAWAEQDLRAAQRQAATHSMAGASHGQLFLLTNIPPERLARRYRWAAYFHCGYWLAALAWLHVA